MRELRKGVQAIDTIKDVDVWEEMDATREVFYIPQTAYQRL